MRKPTLKTIFLSLPFFLLFVCLLFSVLAIIFIANHPRITFLDIRTMLKLRWPFIQMALVNYCAFCAVCFSASYLYGKERLSLFKVRVAALVTIIAGVLMHAMVYGICLFVPVHYSVFGLNHLTMVIFPVIPRSERCFSTGSLWDVGLNAFLHCLAPQTLFAAFVFVKAIKLSATMINKS